MNVTNPINSTGNINFINSFNAKNAFTQKNNEINEDNIQQEENLGVSHINNSILNNIDVDEIQQYASNLGEKALSEDELKYGLIFGRSVLVNVQA